MIPKFLLPDQTFTFRPTDVLFVDRINGAIIEAPEVLNVDATLNMGYVGGDVQWDLNVHGVGKFKIGKYEKDFGITDEDIQDIIEREFLGK